MTAALEVMLEGGQVLLITDADDSLSWHRVEQQGWGVGLYAIDDPSDGPLRFASSDDASIGALLGLLVARASSFARPPAIDRHHSDIHIARSQ